MQTRRGAVAVVVLAVLGLSACSAADPQARPGTAPAAGRAAPEHLRDGLLTQDRLPKGFKLLTAEANLTTTGAPHTPSATPIASMPCKELGVNSFMTAHAAPAEDVAVGLERTPVGDDDLGWFGQEALDRYGPGQAAAVMAAIRGAAQRCTSYTNTLTDGTRLQETVSVTAAAVPGDDSVLLRVTSTFPEDAHTFVGVTGFVRVGDVIVMVQQIAEEKPSSDTEAVLAAAVSAYRAATGG
ncbi:hypothetical protein ACIRD3_04340 [Kitasatospora sp. NPDC093550]|uniref:hypothetical protein n=1 Tax=Kitasatospora sp. NPDC093550 TaxID=3364089 RepID=UPI0037F4F66D